MGTARMCTVMGKPEKGCFTCGVLPRHEASSYCKAHYYERQNARRRARRARERAAKSKRVQRGAP